MRPQANYVGFDAVLLVLIGCWIGVNVLVGAYLVLAGREQVPARLVDHRARTAAVALSVVLATALVGVALTAGNDDWTPLPLLMVLVTLALASDALPVTTGIFRISGSFLALVLAAALLGPAPAAVVGVVSTAVDAARRRPPAINLVVNLVAFTAGPLALGLGLQALEGEVAAGVYAAIVVVATLAADLANFVLVGLPMCWVLRRPFAPMVRTSWLPVLPWQAGTALLVGAAVFGTLRIGDGVIGVAAVSLVAVQIGCRSVVRRRQRRGRLPLRPEPHL